MKLLDTLRAWLRLGAAKEEEKVLSKSEEQATKEFLAHRRLGASKEEEKELAMTEEEATKDFLARRRELDKLEEDERKKLLAPSSRDTVFEAEEKKELLKHYEQTSSKKDAAPPSEEEVLLKQLSEEEQAKIDAPKTLQQMHDERILLDKLRLKKAIKEAEDRPENKNFAFTNKTLFASSGVLDVDSLYPNAKFMYQLNDRLKAFVFEWQQMIENDNIPLEMRMMEIARVLEVFHRRSTITAGFIRDKIQELTDDFYFRTFLKAAERKDNFVMSTCATQCMRQNNNVMLVAQRLVDIVQNDALDEQTRIEMADNLELNCPFPDPKYVGTAYINSVVGEDRSWREAVPIRTTDTDLPPWLLKVLPSLFNRPNNRAQSYHDRLIQGFQAAKERELARRQRAEVHRIQLERLRQERGEQEDDHKDSGSDDDSSSEVDDDDEALMERHRRRFQDRSDHRRDVTLDFVEDYPAQENALHDAAKDWLRARNGQATVQEDAQEAVEDPSVDNTEYQLNPVQEDAEIYKSSQNVHLSKINDVVMAKLELLEKDKVPDETYYSIMGKFIEEITQANLVNEDDEDIVRAIVRSITRISTDASRFDTVSLSLAQIFQRVFYRIMRSKDNKEELLRRMIEELVDTAEFCSTGYASRLVNILSGFDDVDLQVKFQADNVKRSLRGAMLQILAVGMRDHVDESVLMDRLGGGAQEPADTVKVESFVNAHLCEWQRMIQAQFAANVFDEVELMKLLKYTEEEARALLFLR